MRNRITGAGVVGELCINIRWSSISFKMFLSDIVSLARDIRSITGDDMIIEHAIKHNCCLLLRIK